MNKLGVIWMLELLWNKTISSKLVFEFRLRTVKQIFMLPYVCAEM